MYLEHLSVLALEDYGLDIGRRTLRMKFLYDRFVAAKLTNFMSFPIVNVFKLT